MSAEEVEALTIELSELRQRIEAIGESERLAVRLREFERGKFAALADKLAAIAAEARDDLGAETDLDATPVEETRPAREQTSPSAAPAAPPATVATDCKLSKAVREILAVLKAHHPRARTKEQVALQTGRSAGGGGFQNALSQGRTAGLIDGSSSLTITAAGRAAIGNVPPVPRGKALVDYWSAKLEKAPRKILEVLTRPPRRACGKEYIAIHSGYQASGGGFQNALSRLRTLGLIEGSREIKAAEDFF